jgi:hypothetical protein
VPQADVRPNGELDPMTIRPKARWLVVAVVMALLFAVGGILGEPSCWLAVLPLLMVAWNARNLRLELTDHHVALYRVPLVALQIERSSISETTWLRARAPLYLVRTFLIVSVTGQAISIQAWFWCDSDKFADRLTVNGR